VIPATMASAVEASAMTATVTAAAMMLCHGRRSGSSHRQQPGSQNWKYAHRGLLLF
jgi:hypothetical protein